MKKIGIITFQNTTNYGAILQAFALQKKLQLLGADCETINYHCASIEQREGYAFPRFYKSIYKYACGWKDYLSQAKKKKVITEFARRNMIFSERDYDNKTIHNSNEIYDAFITGSDMVWELGITGGDYAFYLDFADPSKRFSYAASIGIDHIDEKYSTKCIEELNKFESISVREISAHDLLEECLATPIRIDVDPTLLHDAIFWRSYEETTNSAFPKEYILLYFLDSEGVMLKKARELAKKKGIPIVIISDRKINVQDCLVLNNISVGMFLYCIDNATLVITGSYHGLVFSINFNTSFMFFNRANSTRMESIAELVGCQGRRLDLNHTPEVEMSFSEINEAIEKLRADSENYLKVIIG